MPELIENKNYKINDSKKAYLQVDKEKKQTYFVTEQYVGCYSGFS